MKKSAILFVFSLAVLGVHATATAAVDLTGQWEGTMHCSNDPLGDPGEYFKVDIVQTGDFFESTNIVPTPGELCGGVLDGNKVSMTCDSGTFAYGDVKGNKIYVINHIPADAATCKGTANRVD